LAIAWLSFRGRAFVKKSRENMTHMTASKLPASVLPKDQYHHLAS
jgi:hypothetical protein